MSSSCPLQRWLPLQLLLTCCACLFLAASCAKAGAGVPELSLPPGSISRNAPEYFRELKADIRREQRGLKVSVLAFDHGGGWEAVYGHVDACMKRAGYPEMTEQYEAAHGGRKKSIDGLYEGDLMRVYEAEELPCSVTLFNFAAMKYIEGYAGKDDGSEAQFALLIVE